MTRSKNLIPIGEAATLAGVSERTVRTWYDLGLIKGHRLPYSRERRIQREDFNAFLENLKKRTEDEPPKANPPMVLFVGFDNLTTIAFQGLHPEFNTLATGSAFVAGIYVGKMNPDAVIVNASIGRIEASLIAKGIHERIERHIDLIAVIEDEDRKPVDFDHYIAHGTNFLSEIVGLISTIKTSN